MKIDMKKANKPTDKDSLKNLEIDISIKLPLYYVDFLLEQNGGTPEKSIFYYGNGGSSAVSFFGINTEDKHSDIKSNYIIYKLRIPGGFLPIGCDPGGNLVCLDVGAGSGVYFWDHELEKVTPAMEDLFLICSTFDGFIEALESDEGEDWL